MKKIWQKTLSFFVAIAILLKVKKKVNLYANSQPYIIGIENTSHEWKEYELFGASRNYLKIRDGVLDMGNDVVIKTNIPNSDYSDLLMASIVGKLLIGMTFFVTNEMSQYIEEENKLLLISQYANGNSSEKCMPFVYDSYQQQTSVILLKEKYYIDAFTSLVGKIAPNSKIQVHFYPLIEEIQKP